MDDNTAMVLTILILIGMPVLAIVLVVLAAKDTKGDDDEP